MTSKRSTILALGSISALALATLAYYYVISPSKRNPADVEIPTYPQDAALAEAARLQGNKLYNDECLDEAIERYSAAINMYPVNNEDRRLAFANRAACYLQKVHLC